VKGSSTGELNRPPEGVDDERSIAKNLKASRHSFLGGHCNPTDLADYSVINGGWIMSECAYKTTAGLIALAALVLSGTAAMACDTTARAAGGALATLQRGCVGPVGSAPASQAWARVPPKLLAPATGSAAPAYIDARATRGGYQPAELEVAQEVAPALP
jgi:hypothetical protein